MQRIITILLTISTIMSSKAQQQAAPADVHAHIVTKEYMDYLRANHAEMEDGYPLPAWSAEEHLRFMDEAGIARPVAMCRKEPMQEDGIVRLSKVDVYPEYLDEYKAFAKEVGATSLLTEPGVLTMYAVSDKENPCRITILETYSSREAYKKHIASEHFQKYKQGTLHMVKHLVLDDVVPLNPDNRIANFIRH